MLPKHPPFKQFHMFHSPFYKMHRGNPFRFRNTQTVSSLIPKLHTKMSQSNYLTFVKYTERGALPLSYAKVRKQNKILIENSYFRKRLPDEYTYSHTDRFMGQIMGISDPGRAKPNWDYLLQHPETMGKDLNGYNLGTGIST